MSEVDAVNFPGIYKVAANPSDNNVLGPLLLHATASACDPRDDTFSIVNYNPSAVNPFSPPTTATFGTLTARDIITRAFDNIGFGSAGQSLQPFEAQDGLRRLNTMISTMALQPGTMLANKREVFDLVADQETYMIGPGGDFNTVRPVFLTGVGLLLTNSSPPVEIPLGLLTDDMYEGIRIKTLSNSQPTTVYYNRTQPLGTIKLWPVPNTAINDLVLYSDEAVSGFADLSTQYTLAPGYAEMFEYNLSERLATPYGRALPDAIKELARSTMGWVKRANNRLTDVPTDATLLTNNRRAGYNINSGYGGGN